MHYCVIDHVDKVTVLLERLQDFKATEGMLAVDTETTGLDPLLNQVRLIALAVYNKAVVVDLDVWRTPNVRTVPWHAEGLLQLRAILESSRVKLLQNAAFDLNFLRAEGVSLNGPIYDTMVGSKIISNGTGSSNALDAVVKRYIDVELPKDLQKSNWAGELTEEQYAYSAMDVLMLPYVELGMTEKLKSSKVPSHKGRNFTLWELFKLEMNVLRPISLMQYHGFNFDRRAGEELREALVIKAEELLRVFLEELDKELRDKHPDDDTKWLPRDPDGTFNTRAKDSGSIRLKTKVYKGFNPRSPKQMAEGFTLAGIILPPDKTGKPSLDKNLLAFIRKTVHLVDLYLVWKKAETEVSDIEKILKHVGPDSRVHGSYRQMGTETGRMSASNPNLQQINRSKDFRSKFRAAEGYCLVAADFSQVELRIAAMISKEPKLIEAYAAGRDAHTETASLLTKIPLDEFQAVLSDPLHKDFELYSSYRTSAKISNFGLLYGAGAATLQKQAVAQYGVDMSPQEAKKIVEDFRLAYPTLYQWQQEQGQSESHAVFTALGRRRMMFGYSHDKYTTRINTVIQGTAGDIAKLAIQKLWGFLRKAGPNVAKLIAMVHDELILEVQEDAAEEWKAILKTCMEEAGNEISTSVPIIADAKSGLTWADVK